MTLLDLPDELLFNVVLYLDDEEDLLAFARANRRLFSLTIDHLYRYNDKHGGFSIAEWASWQGGVDTLRRLTEAGVSLGQYDNFVAAATSGQLEAFKFLLPHANPLWGPDIRYFDEDPSALEIASREGHLEMVEFLLDNGATLERGQRAPALHLATESGHVDVVQFLLDRGADGRTRPDVEVYSPVHAAAEHGHLEILKMLLEKQTNIDVRDRSRLTPLQGAVLGGHADLAEYLLDRGADMSLLTSNNFSILQLAINRNGVEVARLLLDRGASVHDATRAERGRTPLVGALLMQNHEMMRLFLEYGADIENIDHSGKSPLLHACEGNDIETVRLLLDAGANAVAVSPSKCTPLERAATTGNVKIAQLLLDHGASETSFDDLSSKTPLQAAAWKGHINIAKLLFDNGRDPFSTGRRGWLAIHAAAVGGRSEFIRYYLTSIPGADVDARDSLGRTPLFLAALHGCLHAIKELLSRNADINARDKYGASPIFAAARNKGQRQAVAAAELLSHDPSLLLSMDGFGHTPYWWATSQQMARLFDRVIEENDLDIPSSERPSTYLTEREEKLSTHVWCDVCTKKYLDCYSAAHCTVCFEDEFMICSGCLDEGMTCLDESHSVDKWETERGCSSCRLADAEPERFV